MADLFSEKELEELVPKVIQEAEELNNKVFYRGEKGLFTDKETAWRVGITKERDRYKMCAEYYKRLAKRLAEEYNEEHAKVLELQAEIKRLKSTEVKRLISLPNYAKIHLQHQKISAS